MASQLGHGVAVWRAAKALRSPLTLPHLAVGDFFIRQGHVAKLADALRSGRSSRKGLEVQVLSCPPLRNNMEPEILYEDADILAINKPAGLIVHPDGRTKEPSVSEWLVKKYPEAKEVGEALGGVDRPGIVHRIDRETSGVLLLAKTAKGHECLKKQFQNHEVEKTYHAFLLGPLKEDHGSINLSIGRSKADFRKKHAVRNAPEGEAKPALTYYRVIKKTPEWTFVEARPKTGRTHQIRVHFRALHHPIIGDKLYGPKKLNAGTGDLPQFGRLALHAREISFLDTKGQNHQVVAPYPDDFVRAMHKAGLE